MQMDSGKEEQTRVEQVEQLTPLMFRYFRANFKEMPSLSGNAAQIVAMAARVGNAEMTELVNLLRQDPAASAAVLRRANSVMYRRSNDVSSLSEAVVRVGRQEVYNIVTALATRSLFEPKLRDVVRLLPHHWMRLQHHAVVCAFGSAWLSNTVRVGNYESIFLGGMFHDIGKLIALFTLSGIIITKQVKFEISFRASAQAMEQAHVDLGCEMLVHWGMPTYLVDFCAEHHDDLPIEPAYKPLHLIRVVSCLDTLRENAYVPDSLDKELRSSIAALQMTDENLKLVAARLASITDYVTGLLGPATRPAATNAAPRAPSR